MPSEGTITPSAQAQSQIVRPSASLIVVNARNEILLVQRNPQARHFAGAHVFPGGNFDISQDESLSVTAVREVFEETGLLLASATPTSPHLSISELDEARSKIHGLELNFRSFLEKNSLVLNTQSLLPFTQWITPANVLRRFHTQFFVVFLPTAPSFGFSSGSKEEYLPNPDGGREVISAHFFHPFDALSEFRSHKIILMPPQVYILTTLADILQGPSNTAEQRHKVEILSKGIFGSMVINPRRLPIEQQEEEERKDGWMVLTYEGDETRGGSQGRLHRVKVKFAKGLTSDVVLQRNFDIFSEMEAHAYQVSSKL